MCGSRTNLRLLCPEELCKSCTKDALMHKYEQAWMFWIRPLGRKVLQIAGLQLDQVGRYFRPPRKNQVERTSAIRCMLTSIIADM